MCTSCVWRHKLIFMLMLVSMHVWKIGIRWWQYLGIGKVYLGQSDPCHLYMWWGHRAIEYRLARMVVLRVCVFCSFFLFRINPSSAARFHNVQPIVGHNRAWLFRLKFTCLSEPFRFDLYYGIIWVWIDISTLICVMGWSRTICITLFKSVMVNSFVSANVTEVLSL